MRARFWQASLASCVKEVDEMLIEVKLRAEERRRMDELLRIIGVSQGLTLEETTELQSQHSSERAEYQALQDSYRLTVNRVNAMVSRVRELLVDGFPETETLFDEFEELRARYGKPQVQLDVLVLKMRGLLPKASHLVGEFDSAVNPVVEPVATREASAGRQSGHRSPDIKTSRERILLCEQLRRELATLHAEVKKHTTLEKFKTKYPSFRLWQVLSEQEQRELLDGQFKPRAYGDHLTIRYYGLTSTSTLKKDREKLRGAQERPAVQ